MLEASYYSMLTETSNSCKDKPKQETSGRKFKKFTHITNKTVQCVYTVTM